MISLVAYGTPSTIARRISPRGAPYHRRISSPTNSLPARAPASSTPSSHFLTAIQPPSARGAASAPSGPAHCLDARQGQSNHPSSSPSRPCLRHRRATSSPYHTHACPSQLTPATCTPHRSVHEVHMQEYLIPSHVHIRNLTLPRKISMHRARADRVHACNMIDIYIMHMHAHA
jgi:hypothetical protein